jgi:hypothetical protein
MGSKIASLVYQKDNGDGTTSLVAGATVTARVIRVADGYEHDSATGNFLASAATATTMTGSGVTAGWYYATYTTTNWNNGAYVLLITAGKAGESPYSTQEQFNVTSGAASTSAPSAPAATMCRCYVYFADTPATVPTVLTTYVHQPEGANNYAVSQTGTYNSGTGLWYADLLQGSTARVNVPTYGISRTFYVPPVSTAVVLAQREV